MAYNAFTKTLKSLWGKKMNVKILLKPAKLIQYMVPGFHFRHLDNLLLPDPINARMHAKYVQQNQIH